MQANHKIAIVQMAQICAAKGVQHAVFSPGSRNAPMVVAFNQMPEINCHCIVDERAAAFFALGLAQATRKPVAIVCTSGTASLNYAPAIAEALYQKIPLLVLTADRPVEWIDQADMQSIRQQNVFSNYIKKSFQFPQNSNKTDLWFAQRIVNESINQSLYPEAGPVHINVPLTEPLYGFEKENQLPVKLIESCPIEARLPDNYMQELKQIWNASSKKMLIAGLTEWDENLNESVNNISQNTDTIILTETTSNLKGNTLFKSIDRLVDTLNDEQKKELQPDLLITFGGMVVSKKVKNYLREFQPKHHWHISLTYQHFDTYQSLTHLLPTTPHIFLKEIGNWSGQHSDYFSTVKAWDNQRIEKQEEYLAQSPFCDFTVFNQLWGNLPDKAVLQMGNSTPIRYSCLFGLDEQKQNRCYSNRGVGGIDGTLSTAAGYASASDETVIFVTGDLAFFYDSNGLWNPNFPNNLRVILINNQGGNIFRIIPGPDTTEHLQQFFEHRHTLNAQPLCQMFNIDYLCVENKNELQSALNGFYNNSPKARLLEIKTDGELSAKILRQYFEFLKD